MSEAAVEAAKEVARLAVLGAISAVLAWLADLEPTTTVLIATALLRGLDKWIHKSETTELNGLVPF